MAERLPYPDCGCSTDPYRGVCRSNGNAMNFNFIISIKVHVFISSLISVQPRPDAAETLTNALPGYVQTSSAIGTVCTKNIRSTFISFGIF